MKVTVTLSHSVRHDSLRLLVLKNIYYIYRAYLDRYIYKIEKQGKSTYLLSMYMYASVDISTYANNTSISLFIIHKPSYTIAEGFFLKHSLL